MLSAGGMSEQVTGESSLSGLSGLSGSGLSADGDGVAVNGGREGGDGKREKRKSTKKDREWMYDRDEMKMPIGPEDGWKPL